jgi:hypothetical protein
MTFDKFVEALKKAGWVARNDAQHKHIRELWNDLCCEGLRISMPGVACDAFEMEQVPSVAYRLRKPDEE